MKIQKKNLIKIIITIIVIFGVASQWSVVKSKVCSWSIVNCQLSTVNDWYAVTLTNNQIYFGHILSIDRDTIKMSEAHYLEIYSDSTQKSMSANFALEQTPKQVYKLNKKGGDKIATTDHTFSINRSAVLFWEKLTNDAEIVKQIGLENNETK